MFLLDTNVVSELRRPDRADGGVLQWAKAQRAAEFHLSAITILEIELGILRLARKDAEHSSRLRSWMDHVLQEFSRRILPIDLAVAQRCAPLHIPDPLPDRDALIAATALVHGLTVVTRNTKDFAPTGVSTLNPWSGCRS
ncbi:type II toxin-antitoxin system VapC family toxin [Enterovirga aerilata]|uniref:Ribonuclease VapC n=1 Tax=Enterovirga aerilata TaxID=2730920 RepID=A0A849I6P1_9HYPH|nr:type II toxin-antitoxin system VapC family toxin [Enterovirga sp. DB1703]NNM73374.1 type II toxin-antitoxin system VapC family toxin [Enterovirga sp. DB1703]